MRQAEVRHDAPQHLGLIERADWRKRRRAFVPAPNSSPARRGSRCRAPGNGWCPRRGLGPRWTPTSRPLPRRPDAPKFRPGPRPPAHPTAPPSGRPPAALRADPRNTDAMAPASRGSNRSRGRRGAAPGPRPPGSGPPKGRENSQDFRAHLSCRSSEVDITPEERRALEATSSDHALQLAAHLPVTFQTQVATAGVGTVPGNRKIPRWLPRLLRAFPSAGLDGRGNFRDTPGWRQASRFAFPDPMR